MFPPLNMNLSMNDGLSCRMHSFSFPVVALVFASILGLCLAMQGEAEADDRQQDKQARKSVPADHAKKSQQGTQLFKQKVRSILTTHCLKCHGGESVKADFDLSNRAALMESGYVEDTAEASHLFQVINHSAEPVMPLKSEKLAEDAIEGPHTRTRPLSTQRR